MQISVASWVTVTSKGFTAKITFAQSIRASSDWCTYAKPPNTSWERRLAHERIWKRWSLRDVVEPCFDICRLPITQLQKSCDGKCIMQDLFCSQSFISITAEIPHITELFRLRYGAIQDWREYSVNLSLEWRYISNLSPYLPRNQQRLFVMPSRRTHWRSIVHR